MPRSPRTERDRRRRGPGRPRKFKIGALAKSGYWPVGPVVVVDHKVEGRKSWYRAVRVSREGGWTWGPAEWRPTYELEEWSGRYGTHRPGVSIYRANERMGDRGCVCNCCVHSAFKPSDIRPDGSFVWEE